MACHNAGTSSRALEAQHAVALHSLAVTGRLNNPDPSSKTENLEWWTTLVNAAVMCGHQVKL